MTASTQLTCKTGRWRCVRQLCNEAVEQDQQPAVEYVRRAGLHPDTMTSKPDKQFDKHAHDRSDTDPDDDALDMPALLLYK